MIIWHPISELTDKYACNLLICAPELLDLDFNEAGVGMGHWQDDAGDEINAGSWEANKWNGTCDEWFTVRCNPTHFAFILGPNVVTAIEPSLTDFEALSIAKQVDPQAGGFFRRLMCESAKRGADQLIRRLCGRT